MGAEPYGFDLAAAWTRRAGTDMPAFTEALAARLEPGQPGRVAVERALKATAAVDDDLARLKAETRREIEPPR